MSDQRAATGRGQSGRPVGTSITRMPSSIGICSTFVVVSFGVLDVVPEILQALQHHRVVLHQLDSRHHLLDLFLISLRVTSSLGRYSTSLIVACTC